MNSEPDLKTDMIVTTLPIPQSEKGHNWLVSVPVYDRGNRFSNDFETARTLLIEYLYNRLHIHPKYYIYQWSFRANKWELLEEVGIR